MWLLAGAIALPLLLVGPFWFLQSRLVLQYLQTNTVRYFYPTTRDWNSLILTIDDGPDPEITPRILATLKKHGAKATFFLIGRKVAAHPELVQRIVDDGHDIGNHDYDDFMSALRSN